MACDKPFLLEEHVAVKKAMIEENAPGPDGIPAEFVKGQNLMYFVVGWRAEGPSDF